MGSENSSIVDTAPVWGEPNASLCCPTGTPSATEADSSEASKTPRSPDAAGIPGAPSATTLAVDCGASQLEIRAGRLSIGVAGTPPNPDREPEAP